MSENDERPYFSAADFLAALLVHRGIDEDDYCPECGATGTKTYGSSATWSGGVGGQMMTNSVCDKCWGSGSKSRPWASWRQREDLSRKLEEARGRITLLETVIRNNEEVNGARIAELESAIKPFAEAETENEAINADETVLWEQSASGNITYGDLRTARTVLEGKSNT